MHILLSLVIGLPLFSFIAISACGRYIGVYGSMILSTANIAIALFSSISLVLVLVLWIQPMWKCEIG